LRDFSRGFAFRRGKALAIARAFLREARNVAVADAGNGGAMVAAYTSVRFDVSRASSATPCESAKAGVCQGRVRDEPVAVGGQALVVTQEVAAGEGGGPHIE
jgi:hypothetical protein